MTITRKDILRQLKYDLIGKDSYRGVTLTYSWLANQFGHFGLGFVPTFITYVILTQSCGITENAGIYAAGGVWSAWILFEIYNCVKPILFSNQKKPCFATPWPNIIYDTLTDLGFFGLGAFASGSLCEYSHLQMILLLFLWVMLLYPSYDWYRTKMYQQEAAYPFQFRLSQWGGTLSEENKQKVLPFAEANTNGKHLFLFGPYKSGKTTLSVAIANERSIGHNTCLYVTAMKLFSLFFEATNTIDEPGTLWGWRDASLLVIDDINPGMPMKEDVVTPDAFIRFLQGDGEQAEANKKVIREKNIIWVLGEEDEVRRQKWEATLIVLGVEKRNIDAITLR